MSEYVVYRLYKDVRGEYDTLDSQDEAMRVAKTAMDSEGRVGELQIINVIHDGDMIWRWEFGKGVTCNGVSSEEVRQ